MTQKPRNGFTDLSGVIGTYNVRAEARVSVIPTVCSRDLDTSRVGHQLCHSEEHRVILGGRKVCWRR